MIREKLVVMMTDFLDPHASGSEGEEERELQSNRERKRQLRVLMVSRLSERCSRSQVTLYIPCIFEDAPRLENDAPL